MRCDLFHFEASDRGAKLVLNEQPEFSFPLCMSASEIDANAQDLKDHVDHWIARMKRALAEELKKPDFPDANRT